MEENYNATSRNGHESQDMYDPEKPTARKIVYVDMGGVLMDFHAGLELIGGILVSRDGMKKWLWPMVCAITLPDVVYIYLSYSLNSDNECYHPRTSVLLAFPFLSFRL